MRFLHDLTVLRVAELVAEFRKEREQTAYYRFKKKSSPAMKISIQNKKNPEEC